MGCVAQEKCCIKQMQQNFTEPDLDFIFKVDGIYNHFSGFPDDADGACGRLL